MAPRLELQTVLESILGTRNVYFQPPPNISMNYPCIVYERDTERTQHADNVPYSRRKRYKVTYIGQNPDSVIPDLIAELPLCTYDRFYTAEKLNHDVYKLFF